MSGFLKKLSIILFFGFLAFPVSAFCQVDTAWVRRYNGPRDGEDVPVAVAIDDGGNVYVTGFSQFSDLSSQYGYVTIKYDRNGNQLWIRQHPGYAQALVLDSEGNLCVTGLSMGANLDYTTIKYDSQGNELWIARYNGIGDDWGLEITVDYKNNIYVTGGSGGINGKHDIATVEWPRFG